MKFSVTQERDNGYDQYRLTDETTRTTVVVLPENGALLHAFTVWINGKAINIIDNYTDRQNLEEEFRRSYKSAKLSPFVCRIRNGKYEWEGHQYEFSEKFLDGSAIHGILFDKKFTVTQVTASAQYARLVLEYNYASEDAAYPFPYTINIGYTLYPENRLEVTTTIENTGEMQLPVADGWHPYFTFGGSINNYELGISSSQMLEFDAQLIPTGKLLNNSTYLSGAVLADRFLDNCFLLENRQGEPVCFLKDPASGLKLSFFTDGSYPYLQVFTPGHRKSIAIENLSSAPDCFNNKMGLIQLKPGEKRKMLVEYKVETED